MADVKMTKRDYYEVIKGIVEASDAENQAEIVEFIDKQVALLDAKAEKAKERAAKTKAEGDELRAAVQAVLTDEYQFADAIAAQVEGEEITKSKVVARLTQLVAAEVAVKDTIKAEDGRKLVAYKLA